MARTANASTAANARFIDTKLLEAADHARAATKALAEVLEAIEKGENDPEMKVTEIKDLLGTSRTLARATIHAEMPWSHYADARERNI